MAKLTIFLGAFLVFLVQPLVGNTLLPEFGGTSSVWCWCLALFQALLVGGYFYAHRVASRRFKPALHCSLVALSALGPVAIAFGARSPWAVVPLTAVPYVLLSANSSLVQALAGGRYSLYSISNLGSFAGLFAYPFAFELFLPLRWQWTAMAALTVAYAALLFALARGRNVAPPDATGGVSSADGNADARKAVAGLSLREVPEGRRQAPAYFLLSFASCFLLNAVTAHLGSDVTPIPLLWVVLLGVYLLSYVIAFTERGAKWRWWIAVPTALLAIYATLRLVLVGGQYFAGEMLTATLVLLLGGIAIHSKLYRIRPPAAELTRFYLWIAVGGAAGGAFCSFAMPHLATSIVEYPIALATVFAVTAAGKLKWNRSRLLCAALAAIAMSAFGILLEHAPKGGHAFARYRNAYGVGMVMRRPVKLANGSHYYVHDFRCNSTTHGLQILNGRDLLYAPTAYFTPEAGGAAIVRHPKYAGKSPMRVGVLGMGMGTLATYARPGDAYRMYEINPAVRDLALDRRLFTFVPEAKGEVEIVVDDARKALERERAAELPRFDVLYMDVFNGDSVPPHLATREAFGLYRERLAPDGILAVNLTNWHLDLLPLVASAAREFGWNLLAVDCLPTSVSAGSRWAFLASRPLDALFDAKRQRRLDVPRDRLPPLMTDEFHSLLPLLRTANALKRRSPR